MKCFALILSMLVTVAYAQTMPLHHDKKLSVAIHAAVQQAGLDSN